MSPCVRQPRRLGQRSHMLVQQLHARNERLKEQDRHLNLRDPEPVTPEKYCGRPLRVSSEAMFAIDSLCERAEERNVLLRTAG